CVRYGGIGADWHFDIW
nr:immunoglobulin heavy chain junction region [Macaca mulatta]MOX93413.1 immunoglobulin heavy chain junction region [Macaca mulatta]MOX93436.1 immunoglobulin heavy chain junction region [Macaca mulatta]